MATPVPSDVDEHEEIIEGQKSILTPDDSIVISAEINCMSHVGTPDSTEPKDVSFTQQKDFSL